MTQDRSERVLEMYKFMLANPDLFPPVYLSDEEMRRANQLSEQGFKVMEFLFGPYDDSKDSDTLIEEWSVAFKYADKVREKFGDSFPDDEALKDYLETIIE